LERPVVGYGAHSYDRRAEWARCDRRAPGAAPPAREPTLSDETTLGAPIERHARERPEAVAAIDRDRTVTWRELERRIRAAAAWLDARGVRAGDRVALWMDTRIEWLELFHALARLGAASVAVNPRYRADEIADLLMRSRATMLVTQRRVGSLDFVSVLADLRAQAVPSVTRVVLVDADAGAPVQALGSPAIAYEPDRETLAAVADRASPGALAILFTTSGTTRGPKLVMHTQRSLSLHAMRVGPAHGLDAADARLLVALPLAGTFGMTGVLAAWRAGSPIVLHPTFDPRHACETIDAQRITHVYGSDEMARRMLDAADGERSLRSLRVFGFAAFRADAAEVARAAVDRGWPMRGLYGSSEVHALFAIQPADAPLEARLQAGGRPAAGADAQVRVRDPDGGTTLPVGALGDLEIRSGASFVGYLDDPEASAAAIDPDGWFRTGDVGWLRDDGSFVFETRRGDAMRLGGYLVNPMEVESALRRAAGVADAQVVPVEIDGRHRCAAFVIAAPGGMPSPESVIEHARRALAGFKVPVRVWFVDAFPITPGANGDKVQRARLRAMAAQRLANEPGAGGA
jgi:fatty-acyl-CoA synthase